MQRIEGQSAFIVHARPYRETSLLIECLTRDHGRVGLIARGVRRERTRLPRGLLQPLQALRIDWIARGELGTLTAVEPAAAPARYVGEPLLAAMYVNELVLRLVGRGDPHATAFERYADCLRRLTTAEPVAWTLRRFERDLLSDLGYALVLTTSGGAGAPIDAQADYTYDPEAGPRPWRGETGGLRVGGGSLLALAQDRLPDAEGLEQLRRLMRRVIRHHLGGASLHAWGMTLAGIQSSSRPIAEQ